MTNHIAQMHALWTGAMDPELWGRSNAPSDTLLYKDGQPSQVKDLLAISQLLGVPVRIAGSHRSKSVDLPVGVFRIDVWEEETVYVLTRDNFHDMKAVVISSCPLDIPYSVVAREVSAEWLDAEKAKCAAYTKTDLPDGDAWMEDWSRDGIVRDGGRIYRSGCAYSCYYEGIERVAPEDAFTGYVRGCSMFAAPVDGAVGIMTLVQAVTRSVQALVSLRREKDHAMEMWLELSPLEDRNQFRERRFAEVTAQLQGWGMLDADGRLVVTG